jgi:hypothetical protein
MAAGSIVMGLRPEIFSFDPGTLERGGVCIVKRFRRTLALARNIVAPGRAKREHESCAGHRTGMRQLRCSILHKALISTVLFAVLSAA